MSDKKSPVRNKESSRSGVSHSKASSNVSSKASSPKSAGASKSSSTTTTAAPATDDHVAGVKAGKKRLYSGGGPAVTNAGSSSTSSSSSSSSKISADAKADEDDRRPQSKRKKTTGTTTVATTTTITTSASSAKNVTTTTTSTTTTTMTATVSASPSTNITDDSAVADSPSVVAAASGGASDCVDPGALGSPSGSGKSAGSGRLNVPLSERQQMAMLMQISKADTPTTGGDAVVAGDVPQSPHAAATVFSTAGSRRTPTTTAKRLNKRNEKGETQLHLACIKGDVRRVRKLVKAGADVNVKDFAGWAPLHEACNHGFVSIAKHLLKAGADANARGLDDDTPLHDAAMNGHERLVKLLLRQGANPKQANAKGKTPLDATNAIKPNIKALLTREDLSTLASSEDESMSDDGEPLTSDDDDDATEAFDVTFAPIGGGGGAAVSLGDKDAETDAADASDGGKEESSGVGTATTTSSAASSSKKLRERKSGSESGDGKSVSSPRFRHHKKSMPDSSAAKTRVDSGNSTPDSTRNAQLQLLRAAAEAEYAFQSDDDEPGSTSGKEKRTKAGKLGAAAAAKVKQPQRSETTPASTSKKGGTEASPSVEAAKSDSNDSDAWRANVDKVIEKLGEDDIDSEEGKKSSAVSSSTEGTKDAAFADGTAGSASKSSITLKAAPSQKKAVSPNASALSSTSKTATSNSVTTSSSSATGVVSSSSAFPSVTSITTIGSTTTTTTTTTTTSRTTSSTTDFEQSDGTTLASHSNNGAGLSSTTSGGSDTEGAVASTSAGANGSRGASPARSLNDNLKVPPLKIILHANNSSTDVKTRVHESVHSAKQALPYVVVKADGEGNGQRDSPVQDNSNSSSGLDAAVSSSTPGGAGGGNDRDATASPNPLKRDSLEKDGGNKSRGSSREKEAVGVVGVSVAGGAAAGDSTSEGRRMTRRATAAAATGSESATGVADSSSGYIAEESGSNGEKLLPQPPRKRKPRVARTGAIGSQNGSDHSTPVEPPAKKLDKDGAKDTQITPIAVAQSGGVGSASTHSGNGVDSTSAASGGANQDVDVAGISAQDEALTSTISAVGPATTTTTTAAAITTTTAAAAAVVVVAAVAVTPITLTSSVASAKEDTPGATEQRNYLYKPKRNCIERYLGIRSQVDERRKGQITAAAAAVAGYKLPDEHKDMMITKKNYILAGNPASKYSIPHLSPPQTVTGRMRELFIEQENQRYKLRSEHRIQREKLILAMENELMRCHAQAALYAVNATVPLSACSVLKDQEIYNMLPQKGSGGSGNESNGNNGNGNDPKGRSKYNGRQVLSWRQDVIDKFEKKKEELIARHHHEAESLHAFHKMHWELTMHQCGMRPDLGLASDLHNGGSGRYCPVDEVHVPMVQVPDDWELITAS